MQHSRTSDEYLFRIRCFNGKRYKRLSKVVWIVLNNICLESDVKGVRFVSFYSQKAFDVPTNAIVIP